MCSKKYNFLGVFAFALCLSVADSVLPPFIKVCQRSDPDLANCIIKSIEYLRPNLVKGIPELEVPSLDPLTLDRFTLNTGPEAARINANVSNLKVWGSGKFRILELIPKVEKNTFKFRVSLPSLRFEGDYELDMKILLLTLKGKGPITGNLTDYTFDCIMKGHIIKRDGEEYLEFDKMKLRIGVGKAQMYLGNLFNGDKVLGRAANDVINDNSDIFLNEIKPALAYSLSEKFTGIANKITLRFTHKELFP